MNVPLSHELAQIPENKKGIERVEAISLIVSNNSTYRIECKAKLESFLQAMTTYDASDMDFGGLGADNKIWLRIHGKKSPFPELGEISHSEATAIICSILSEKNIERLVRDQSADFSYKMNAAGASTRFRSNTYMDMDFLAVNFRKINPVLFPMDSFGFPPPIIRRVDFDFEQKGLILITGVTGSGKSTTLDAIINLNNENNQGHITIIGNPIEYFHRSNQCIVRHREVGKDTTSFKQGTVESLRQDPDIIVIGEMRDSDTIMTALEITDSGHKVFSTLHTGSATESVHRIIAECPVEEQERVRYRLADVLSVVICQKLVPTTDGKRILAKEILNVTPNISAAIINNNVSEIYQMINEGKEYGMVTMEQDLMRLFINKIITRKVAIGYANNKKRIIDLLKYYQNKVG